ncbi:hypothetical protein ACFX2I_001332 [Malus domestica]
MFEWKNSHHTFSLYQILVSTFAVVDLGVFAEEVFWWLTRCDTVLAPWLTCCQTILAPSSAIEVALVRVSTLACAPEEVALVSVSALAWAPEEVALVKVRAPVGSPEDELVFERHYCWLVFANVSSQP